LEFPELSQTAQQEAAWTVTVTGDELAARSESELGLDEVEPGIPVRLLERGDSWVLRYADAGDYVIHHATRTISWHRKPGALDANARLDILGRVFAAALHAAGYYVLHGGSVAIGDRAIAFVAPKRAGKSTLVAQLVTAGAQFVSDDTLPVSLGAHISVLPCGKSIRLLSDSFDHLQGLSAELRAREQVEAVEKPSLLVADDAVRHSPVILDAIYVLMPGVRTTGAGDAVKPARQRLAGPNAAVELVRHSKLGPLLGGIIGTESVERAMTVATTVPVYALSLPHDFNLRSSVVATIFDWHDLPSALGDQPTRSL
jgi:hypothetical protein